MAASHKKGTLIFEFGPFRLDLPEHRLWRDDCLVDIKGKPFTLLVVLVQNSKKLVKKDDLMKLVWPDVFVKDETLAQNIKTLRKALGDSAKSQRYIQTVSGQGYRFEQEVTVREMRRALAVLPFLPFDSKFKDEMLGLGLASAVISRLDSLGIKDLIVRPRSAIIRYNTEERDALAAAREQDADYVL